MKLDEAVRNALAHEYKRGKRDGLATAKLIRGWLTRQPDTKWQKQVRGWADKAIKEAEGEL